MARSVRIHLASTSGSAGPALLQADPWPRRWMRNDEGCSPPRPPMTKAWTANDQKFRPRPPGPSPSGALPIALVLLPIDLAGLLLDRHTMHLSPAQPVFRSVMIAGSFPHGDDSAADRQRMIAAYLARDPPCLRPVRT